MHAHAMSSNETISGLIVFHDSCFSFFYVFFIQIRHLNINLY